MATHTYYTGYFYNGYGNARYRIRLTLVESQNVANNTTTLSVTANFQPESSGSHYAFNSGNTIKITINGTVICNGNPGRVAAFQDFGTWSTSAISHNSDGTKTVSVAVYYNQTQDSGLTINDSGSVTLTPIVKYCKIYTSSGWKKAIPWIYTGSGWKRAVPWVYTSAGWKPGARS